MRLVYRVKSDDSNEAKIFKELSPLFKRRILYMKGRETGGPKRKLEQLFPENVLWLFSVDCMDLKTRKMLLGNPQNQIGRSEMRVGPIVRRIDSQWEQPWMIDEEIDRLPLEEHCFPQTLWEFEGFIVSIQNKKECWFFKFQPWIDISRTFT